MFDILSKVVSYVLRAVRVGNVFVKTIFSSVGQIVDSGNCIGFIVLDCLSVYCKAFNVSALVNDKSDNKAFARYREIDKDIKRDALKVFEAI